MAFNLGKMVEGPSYAVLNEILGEYRTNEGFSRPSRYEILLLPPTGVRGTASNGGDVTNIFSKVMDPNKNAPCSIIANDFVVGDLTNFEDVVNFGKEVDVVTVEIENVNTDALEFLENLKKIE